MKYLKEAMSVFAIRRFQSRLLGRQRESKEFPVPLLLLYAKSDPMVPPRIGRVLADRIPGSKLVWLEEASHFAHVDAPKAFLPPTLDFLAEHG